MVIFTSICANYLHKARTLAKSVKEHMPDATFLVCMTEREITSSMEYPYFDRIVLSKDAWDGNFDQFIFKHAIVEASTAVKGQFFRYLYKEYPNETEFVYLDPDIYVYGDFVELKELLKSRPIVICPHLLKPGNIDMELSSTAHGVYNLGFLGVNRSDEAMKMIDWWASRLSMFCYDDIINGIFTDQKWIDLVPCFFDAHIFKHHGYDFATWSLMDSPVEYIDGKYFVQGDPLRFIHYSGYGNDLEKCMKNWLPEGEQNFHHLYAEYKKLHDGNNQDNVSKTTWTYSTFHSGDPVRTDVRRAYRANPEIMNSHEDPFAYSNVYFNLKLHAYPFTLGERINIYFSEFTRIIKQNGIGGVFKKIARKIKG